MAVASAGPFANLHLDPDTTTPASTTQYFTGRPTNSVKALKAHSIVDFSLLAKRAKHNKVWEFPLPRVKEGE